MESQKIGFYQALRFWLRLGFISFGGPAGQIAVMHQELVERQRWISERRFLHALNYCMLLPGPEGQQLATYLGWLLHRSGGGVVAGCLFVLPSFFVLVLLSWIYLRFGTLPIVSGAFYAVKPAVTAIVVFAAIRIGRRSMKHQLLWAIAIGAFLLSFFFDVPFPALVLTAGLIGYVGGRLAPQTFQPEAKLPSKDTDFRAAVIDDDTPIPEHAKFHWPRLWRQLFVGLGLWAGTLGMLVMLEGTVGPFTQMAWFFTKAALLTFGGVYTVLPYVYDGAVEEHHWLTMAQMMDGLALGETTPGPLIMIVTFVGFLGGSSHALAGDSPLLGGIIGAAVVTFFTFLPSFIFILVGGPVIESTHGNLSYTAPLTGITAAVVGVILHLAMFFGYHVLWPQGFAGRFDVVSAILGIAAFTALFRYKVSVITVVVAFATLGLLVALIRAL